MKDMFSDLITIFAAVGAVYGIIVYFGRRETKKTNKNNARGHSNDDEGHNEGDV